MMSLQLYGFGVKPVSSAIGSRAVSRPDRKQINTAMPPTLTITKRIVHKLYNTQASSQAEIRTSHFITLCCSRLVKLGHNRTENWALRYMLQFTNAPETCKNPEQVFTLMYHLLFFQTVKRHVSSKVHFWISGQFTMKKMFWVKSCTISHKLKTDHGPKCWRKLHMQNWCCHISIMHHNFNVSAQITGP